MGTPGSGELVESFEMNFCLLILALLPAVDTGFTVRETALPCGSELKRALAPGSGERRFPVDCLKGGLPDRWIDKRAREITLGERSIRLEVGHINTERAGEAYLRYEVYSDGKLVYDFREPLGPSSVWSFFGHGDDWILETRAHVIVSGEDIADANGLDEVGEYRFLAGRPVFLAQKGAKYLLMTGQGPVAEYDRVFYHQCCDYAALNPGCGNDTLSFYAMRGDDLIFVEVQPRD